MCFDLRTLKEGFEQGAVKSSTSRTTHYYEINEFGQILKDVYGYSLSFALIIQRPVGLALKTGCVL